MNPYILDKPVITEKSFQLTQTGVYAFYVLPSATKGQVKEAVEKMFNVNVVNVKTTTLQGKVKRTGSKRTPVKQPDRKKAYVRLVAGQKIELFDIMTGKTQ